MSRLQDEVCQLKLEVFPASFSDSEKHKHTHLHYFHDSVYRMQTCYFVTSICICTVIDYYLYGTSHLHMALGCIWDLYPNAVAFLLDDEGQGRHTTVILCNIGQLACTIIFHVCNPKQLKKIDDLQKTVKNFSYQVQS